MVVKYVSYFKGGMQAKGFENRILRHICGPKRDENREVKNASQ